MKSAIVIFAVFLAASVDSASYSRKHNAVKSSKAAEGNSEWPQPDIIRDFEVPSEFTENPSNFTPTLPGGDNDETTSPSGGKHHGKSNHKSHSH